MRSLFGQRFALRLIKQETSAQQINIPEMSVHDVHLNHVDRLTLIYFFKREMCSLTDVCLPEDEEEEAQHDMIGLRDFSAARLKLFLQVSIF